MPWDKWAAWPWGDHSAGGGTNKRICSCSASQISCPMHIVLGSCWRWGRPLGIMHVTHGQHHHGKAAQEAHRDHQSLLCDCPQCDPACCDCPQLVSAGMALTSWHGTWWFWLQGTDCSRAKVPLQWAGFLPATDQDGYIPFYPYVAHNNN